MYGYNPIDSGEGGTKFDYAAEFAEAQVRKGFVRKVFGILAVQLLITAATGAVFVLNEGAQLFVMQNVWTVYVAMGVTLAVALTIGCCEGPRKTYPWNYLLLLTFTVAESFLVGVISAAYDTQVVLLAFGLTCLITVGLTLFACQTKWDFTMMGGVLTGLLVCLIGASLIMAFFPRTNVGTIAISSVGALLFSAYLIYDVQLLMGGRAQEYGPDDYVAVALSLYLDIINLFLYLLQLLQAISGDRN
mmetsp:Transcript_16811/g.43605  ORF Transcript_16811/g.43605 Transcript_16811/m.43605 type:complete len:246 (-) Transcript_16811:584-1321(-)